MVFMGRAKGEAKQENRMFKVMNFGKQPYFEVVSKKVTFRVWLNPGKARKTIGTPAGVTWSAVVDDFGNLV